jgi:hypothetical protein
MDDRACPSRRLKNVVVAFFNLAQVRSKAPHGSKNDDLRRRFGITSMCCSGLLHKPIGCCPPTPKTADVY